MAAWRRSGVFRSADFAVEDLVLAHLLPQHLAADPQVLRRVLALPVVDLERRDDAVAFAAVPALAQVAAGGIAMPLLAATAFAPMPTPPPGPDGRCGRAAREREPPRWIRCWSQLCSCRAITPTRSARVAQLAHVAGEVGLGHRVAEPVRRFAERLELVAQHVGQQRP